MFQSKKPSNGHVTSSTETISPKEAQAILDRSSGRNYRPIRMQLAERIAAAIKENRWSVNGESIILDSAGHLLDGQHRLKACVLADKPIVTVVARGASDDTYIDSGMSRSAAQILHKLGIQYASVVAAVAKIAISYEKGVRSVSIIGDAADRGELVEYVTAHPEIQESARVVDAVRRIMPASVPVWIHYEAARRGLGAVAEAFFDAVADGAGLEKSSPALHLRNRMLGSRGTVKISKWHSMVLAAKAWNAWASGEPVYILKVYSGREGQVVLPEFYSEVENSKPA